MSFILTHSLPLTTLERERISAMDNVNVSGVPANQRQDGILVTLQRGLRLLEAVAEGNGEATAKSLSYRLGIKLGTCYHLLRTMESENYIVRLPGGRFGLGSRVAFLQDSLRSMLAPSPELLNILARLREEVDETTYLTGWYGDDIVLQRYLEGSRALHVRSLEIGYRGYAHARASGKAILAFLPESQVRDYFAWRGLPRRTAATITTLDTLLDHLRMTARRGWAVDHEEFSEGVVCIASPFFDRSAFPVGSYTVPIPAVRYAESGKALVRAVVGAAREASRLLGCPESHPPPSPLFAAEADTASAPRDGSRAGSGRRSATAAVPRRNR